MTTAKPKFRKCAPPDAVELTGFSADGSLVAARDGTLMLMQGGGVAETGQKSPTCRTSTDGGRTWSEPSPVSAEIGAGGVIRLQSGALGMYGQKGSARGPIYFSSSPDDGATWTPPVDIGAFPGFHPMFHSMIQLSSGRLLLTGYWEGLDGWEVHPELQYGVAGGFGAWRGHRVHLEGHGHAPEMAMTLVYRSDDEGATWQKHAGGLMGWFDFEGVVNGACGQTGCYEPSLAETRDGNVLLIMRSTVGRLVQSVSTDGGEMWSAVKPTDLPSCESPALVVTLPQTRDLLIVWNQESRDEIRRGFRRGRFSAALSRDGGHSWEKFKTLELCEGLEDVDRVTPEHPLQMVRARDWVGTLPDGFARFHYPNVDVVGDQVFIRYGRMWFEEVAGQAVGANEMQHRTQHGSEAVMRVYPLEYFYE